MTVELLGEVGGDAEALLVDRRRTRAGTCSACGPDGRTIWARVPGAHASGRGRRRSRGVVTDARSPRPVAVVSACGPATSSPSPRRRSRSARVGRFLSRSVSAGFARPPAEPLRQAVPAGIGLGHPRDDAARDRRGRAEADPGGLGGRRCCTPRRRAAAPSTGSPGRRVRGDRRADGRDAASVRHPRQAAAVRTRTAWPRPCPRRSRQKRAGPSRWRSWTPTTGASTCSGRAPAPASDRPALRARGLALRGQPARAGRRADSGCAPAPCRRADLTAGIIRILFQTCRQNRLRLVAISNGGKIERKNNVPRPGRATRPRSAAVVLTQGSGQPDPDGSPCAHPLGTVASVTNTLAVHAADVVGPNQKS